MVEETTPPGEEIELTGKEEEELKKKARGLEEAQ